MKTCKVERYWSECETEEAGRVNVRRENVSSVVDLDLSAKLETR